MSMLCFLKALLFVACASGFLRVAPACFFRETALTMKSKGWGIAISTIAGIALPLVAGAADLDAGAQIFGGNCAACHAGGNNVIQNEKTLRKDALEQYLEGGLKEESIIAQVTNGKNAMPAFGGRLDEDEISNVAAYVYDQASASKWD